MKIRFLETRIVDDFRKGTADEERFDAGQTYDLSDESARRWLARQVAEEAPAPAAEPPEPAAAAPVEGKPAIPDGWEKLSSEKVRKLAADLTGGPKPANKGAAIDIIQKLIAGDDKATHDEAEDDTESDVDADTAQREEAGDDAA